MVGPKIMYSIRKLVHAELNLAWLKFAIYNPGKLKLNKVFAGKEGRIHFFAVLGTCIPPPPR